MRAVVKLLLLAVWLPVMMLLTTPFWLLRREKARRTLARWTFQGVARLFGLHVEVKGALSPYRPLLLVANHCSYLDILALGSTLPVAFTPKKEIRHWPLIGFCCRLSGCVFIERTPRAITQTKAQIAQRLGMGRVMCIFPEGTTNDGTHLRPFKSSFFSLAEAEAMAVQPAVLCYRQCDGRTLDAAGRAQLAWYDDMALLPHLWRVLNKRRITVCLRLLPALEPGAYATRKALCAASEMQIRLALAEGLTA